MKNILIIDDAELMRLRLKEILSQSGYNIVGEAANGIKGVELYKRLTPDITTLDISMPEQDGIETLKQIMNYDNNAKVIIISAVGQKRLVIQAIQLGAKNFVIKPFVPDDVIEKISKLA